MRSEIAIQNQKEYIRQYQREHYRTINVRFDKTKDKYLLEVIASKPNASEFIRNCIAKVVGTENE